MKRIEGNMIFTRYPSWDAFRLHSHDFYELYIFIEGDTEFIVEGTTYTLEKYDTILVRPNEMHRTHHKSVSPYKRIVFEIPTTFFEENNCASLTKIFSKREFGTQNKISGKTIKSTGCLDAVNRWIKYTENGRFSENFISKAILTEILYILNNSNILFEDNQNNNLVRQVITYINNNFTEKISLDELATKFYVSKYHLCHTFKNSTGYTITSFINNKRIMHTKILHQSGMSLSSACVNAGFSNYSSFYAAQRSMNAKKEQVK